MVFFFHGDRAIELFFPLFWCIFVEVWAELLFLLRGSSRGAVLSTEPSWGLPHESCTIWARKKNPFRFLKEKHEHSFSLIILCTTQ